MRFRRVIVTAMRFYSPTNTEKVDSAWRMKANSAVWLFMTSEISGPFRADVWGWKMPPKGREND